MENNNTKMIRHFINLMESVNNKILVDTLQNKENTLEEQIQTGTKLLMGLKGLANADEIAKNVSTLSGIKGINTYDDLVAALGTTISNTKATQIVKNLIKSIPELKNTFKAELMSMDDFIRGAQEVYPNGVSGQLNASKEAIVMKTLKYYGYADDEARAMIRTTAERAGRIQPNRLAGSRLKGPRGGTKKPSKTEIAPEAAKAADEIPEVTAEQIKKSRFRTLVDGTKQFVWDKKWGILTAATALGAWWLLSNGGKEEVKILDPNGNDVTPVEPKTSVCNKALEVNEGPKIEEFTLAFPGDSTYKYVFKNGKWFTLNLRTQKRFALTDLINNGCTKYQSSVDKLNKQFPNTNQTTTDNSSTTPNNIKNQTDSLVNLRKTQYPGIYGTDVSQFNVQ